MSFVRLIGLVLTVFILISISIGTSLSVNTDT